MEAQERLNQHVDQIEDRLYLGDKQAASNVQLLKALKITHVLTVEMEPLDNSVLSALPHLKTLHVQVLDLPEADLLSSFDVVTQFIQDGVRNRRDGDDVGDSREGGVLVHCFHGVSRSATCVAAFFMKQKNLSSVEAIKFIQSKRSAVDPNAGFRLQLLLFEKMAFTVDQSNKSFNFYKLNQLHNNVIYSGSPPDSSEIPAVQYESGMPPSISFRCRKCRTLLITDQDVFPHQSKVSPTLESILDWSSADQECQAGIFARPSPNTMADIFQISSENRLLCRKCSYKLGSFSWISMVSCSCGAHLKPAFWINLSRLDKSVYKKS